MKHRRTGFSTKRSQSLFILSVAAVSLFGMNTAVAQNSSLFQRPFAHLAQKPSSETTSEMLPPLTPQRMTEPLPPATNGSSAPPYGQSPMMPNERVLGLQTSWSYAPPTPIRVLKLHDIVHIRVEEASTTLALGNATSRKTTSYDAVLKDWIRLVGLDTVKPAPQSDGDPRVQTSQNEVYRGDSSMRTSESFTTNIAAEIVDIRPNGLVVLSAQKTVSNDEDSYSWSIVGTCRDKDIDPSNTVLSRHLFDSKIVRESQGHVRDGYSRGFLTKFLARFKPF
ncbi:MAG: flagellar basal body L-ring protein FlgH [Pirellula sp.]